MPTSPVRATAITSILAVLLAAAPATRADGDAVAIVNGSPITKQRLVDALIDSHGVELLQQLVLLDLARNECQQRKLRVTKGEIDVEYDRALDQLAQQAGLHGVAANPQNKEEALQSMLDAKRLSKAEFRLTIERNAHLRKLVEPDLKITESTLRAEFARTYGERRVIRHIQIPLTENAALNDAMNALKGGMDFADAARRYSRHDDKENGGLVDPFAFDTPEIPPAMREAAFALRPGEISTPVRTDLVFQIIRLEQVIAPENVAFEDVRDQIERGIRERVTQAEMNKRMVALFEAAKVNVVDNVLKPRYDEFRQNIQRVEKSP